MSILLGEQYEKLQGVFQNVGVGKSGCRGEWGQDKFSGFNEQSLTRLDQC